MSYIDQELYLIVGNALRDARDAAQMTLAEAAKKMGVTTMTIQRYEKAERKATVETIRKLCTIYGVDADSFMQKAINSFNDLPCPSSSLTPAEQVLLSDFRQLNDEGQDKVTEYTSDLVASGRYDVRAGEGAGSGSGEESA